MYFQLKKIILWPRNGNEPRILEFESGLVNVISGASKTGKSAVIPIIDYCLGADKCAIPVGTIREKCAWFGVLIETLEGMKLIARREPEDQQNTSDMVLLEGISIEIPQVIKEKTTNVSTVKTTLNRLAGLTSLDFEPDTDNGFKSRPSFRDLMAFCFQPQNIIANPDVMFFKADTTEHREKLKTIFPYILGAVTPEILQARYELERLNKNLRRKESELKNILTVASAWKLEAQLWLRQAIEYGLLPADHEIPKEWPEIIGLLSGIVAHGSRVAKPTIAGMDVALNRLEQLRHDESVVSLQLSEHRKRLNELRRLIESSEVYGTAMRVQRDRIALADWLREQLTNRSDALAQISGGHDKLLQLCNSLDGIEFQLRSHPSLSNTLDKEILRQRSATETVPIRLNEIRSEMVSLEKESDTVRESMQQFDKIERFLGRTEQALRLYNDADQSSELQQEIESLKNQVKILQAKVSERDIQKKLRNAISLVEIEAGRLLPLLDAEWPYAPIQLVIQDLTIKVIRPGRNDYLWEIGSGANWLAYHIVLTTALQKYFLNQAHHPVPGLLIYDQPSQVYFPKRVADDEVEVTWKDQDILATRKVFDLLGRVALEANSRLQVIVLDHAHEDVWGSLDGIKLIEEWRDGKALIPLDW